MYTITAISLILLSVVTLYALITSVQTKPILLTLIIPLTLAASVLSIYTMNWYKGAPLPGFPEENVTIRIIDIGKPEILILAKREKEEFFRYWAVPYTKENAETAAIAQRGMSNGGIVEGKFSKVKRFNSDETIMVFKPTEYQYEEK